jgi:DNA-directed RNA polymerase subunit RPC12/RpoP
MRDESMDDVIVDPAAVACERCGHPVSNPLSLPATTGVRGADVYRCTRCDHLTYRWRKPRRS